MTPINQEITMPLFDHAAAPIHDRELLGPGTAILSGFALPDEGNLLKAFQLVVTEAPFRFMVTPGGHQMSVAMTNCGTLGWVADRNGYRYSETDPQSEKPWPPMPDCFLSLAIRAAEAARFPDFEPDACLINRYEPGARLSLHQDKNECDLGQPIVSVSLGLSAMFLFGGLDRTDKTVRLQVRHGDVIVWGGPARLRYHGVLPLKDGVHPATGAFRINLTFRKAGK